MFRVVFTKLLTTIVVITNLDYVRGSSSIHASLVPTTISFHNSRCLYFTFQMAESGNLLDAALFAKIMYEDFDMFDMFVLPGSSSGSTASSQNLLKRPHSTNAFTISQEAAKKTHVEKISAAFTQVIEIDFDVGKRVAAEIVFSLRKAKEEAEDEAERKKARKRAQSQSSLESGVVKKVAKVNVRKRIFDWLSQTDRSISGCSETSGSKKSKKESGKSGRERDGD